MWKWICTLVLLPVALWCPQLAAQSILKVYPQVQVSGAKVCAADLGTIYARQRDKQQLESVCFDTRRLVLARNADGSVALTLIRELVGREFPDVDIVGQDQILILTQPRKQKYELVNIAQQWLQLELEKNYASVVVVPAARQPPIRWDESLDWLARHEEVYPTRYQCVWLDGRRGSQIKQSIPVCFKVSAMAMMPVYGKDLKVDEVLEPNLLNYRTFDVARLKAQPIVLEAEQNYVATSIVKSGSPLLSDNVRVRPAVLRDGTITIVSKVGKIEIVARGVAMEEGEIGDQVRVKTHGSEETFRAWVDAMDRVVIAGDA